MADPFNFKQKEQAFNRLMGSAGLPIIIGNKARNFFLKSFRDGGFTDNGLQPWKPRKSQRDNAGRAILVKTGDLRRSVRVLDVSKGKVTIGSDLPYAAVHNYGLRAGRGEGFQMPKREFVGHSATLDRQLIKEIDRQVMKILNG